jgi:hypothetical protein
MQSASVYVREMFAITESVKKWRQYLIGRHFHIYTDQKSLRNLLVQTIQTPEQQKWASKLQGFSFDIFYKPGKSNLVADALSRKDASSEPALLSLSSAVPSLIARLQHYYTTNPEGQQLIHKISTEENTSPHYNIKDQLLYFKNRLFVPDIPDLRRAIISEYHTTPLAGHSGLQPTLARLAASFLWPGIYKDVKAFIITCASCQHNKYIPQRKQGLLQPLKIPEKV